MNQQCNCQEQTPEQGARDEWLVLGSSLFTVFLCLFVVLFS